MMVAGGASRDRNSSSGPSHESARSTRAVDVNGLRRGSTEEAAEAYVEAETLATPMSDSARKLAINRRRSRSRNRRRRSVQRLEERQVDGSLRQVQQVVAEAQGAQHGAGVEVPRHLIPGVPSLAPIPATRLRRLMGELEAQVEVELLAAESQHGMVKGKGAAGKEKENGKAKTKAKSVNYLIRQDSPLPPPVPRKGKHKARIRKAKEFPNAPMGECYDKEKEEDEDEDAEDEDALNEDAEDEDKEYDEQNLFVVPPLQGGGDMSDDDTSDGYKESADELEGGDTMSEESLVHVVSSEDSEEEARERKKKKNKRPRANAPVRAISDVWAHFHKVELEQQGRIRVLPPHLLCLEVKENERAKTAMLAMTICPQQHYATRLS
ncbi:hypothetical protein ZWY2020_057235 [Hordeum vulgare]|nr:hypothetical protein ZWY2020_057235 [Hordeum vulgare]